MRTCLFLCLLVLGATAQGRDSREEKRKQTKDLRRFIQLLEYSYDDPNYLSHASMAKRRSELSEKLEQIAVKLSPKKRKKLKDAVGSYMALFGRADFPKGSQKAYSSARATTLELFRVVLIPSQSPNFSVGKKVYEKQCQQCHGSEGKGDGIYTKNPKIKMEPPPKDLTKQFIEGSRSPFSYFNSTLAGSEGSSMPKYEFTLSAHEMWSVAFYMAHSWNRNDRDRTGTNAKVSMESISKMTGYELKALGLNDQDLRYLRDWRSFDPKTPRK